MGEIDSNIQVQLVDFGIADLKKNLNAKVIFTESYAPPEMFRRFKHGIGNPMSSKHDEYSTGVVLYRLVCVYAIDANA